MGLQLTVRISGAKNWRFQYRFAGKQKMLAFGVYPTVTLAEAREKRDVARKLLAQGIAPSVSKKEEKPQRTLQAAQTFRAVVEEWHKHSLDKWTPGYGKNILHRLEMDIFPQLGHRPIAEIKPLELLATIRKIESRGAREIAHRLLQTCSQIFRYAIVTGRAEHNPAGDLKGALKPVEASHYSALDPKDLPQFVRDLDQNKARLYAHTRPAIKFLMLTFVRTGELIRAKWDEFDFGEQQWVIPRERMKMRLPHVVPLSSQSLAVLKELRAMSETAPYVFPSQVRGYKGRMTDHGFRALAMSTIKEKLGVRHEVIDRQLAHAPQTKVMAAYDRAQFLDERRKMMQDWADYIDRIAGNNIVSMPARAE